MTIPKNSQIWKIKVPFGPLPKLKSHKSHGGLNIKRKSLKVDNFFFPR